jgi:hypothetical protein
MNSPCFTAFLYAIVVLHSRKLPTFSHLVYFVSHHLYVVGFGDLSSLWFWLFYNVCKEGKKKTWIDKNEVFLNSLIKMVFSKTDLVTTNFGYYFKTFKTNKRTSVLNICYKACQVFFRIKRRRLMNRIDLRIESSNLEKRDINFLLFKPIEFRKWKKVQRILIWSVPSRIFVLCWTKLDTFWVTV